MAKFYYVNKKAQSGEGFEVHTEDCEHLPYANKTLFLGLFRNCQCALQKAKEHFGVVEGCVHCCAGFQQGTVNRISDSRGNRIMKTMAARKV